MENKLKGRWGEAKAAAAYIKKGYILIDTNYRTRLGEIDLILRKRNTVVFAEVKLRRNSKFAAPGDFVGPGKQAKIKMTASIWLSGQKNEYDARFDVVEIIAPEGFLTKQPEINIIEDAFE